MTSKIRIGLAAVVVAAMTAFGAISASAHEPTNDPDPGVVNVTGAMPNSAQLAGELQSSSLPRSEQAQPDGSTLTTYTLPDGTELGVESPNQQQRVSGGINSYGIWLKFTETEQEMVLAGGGAVLGTLICAAGGVPVCAIVAGVIAAVSVYVVKNGLCSNRLLIYPFNGSRDRCA